MARIESISMMYGYVTLFSFTGAGPLHGICAPTA